MGFLKKFFRSVFHEGAPTAVNDSSFERLSEEELETHLGVNRYGKFMLTEAVRPSYDLKVVPKQGFRHDHYVDEETKTKVPVLMAAASREQLFDLFIELLEPLGHEVDVVLETSHNRDSAGHTDLYREHIDLPVFKSMLWDYEDLLMNDGCTGMAVLNPSIPQEVQFDEHKLLICYARDLRPFRSVLDAAGIAKKKDLPLIFDAPHLHYTKSALMDRFDELARRVGVGAEAGMVAG